MKITIEPPATNFAAPAPAELAKLLKIVSAAHPQLCAKVELPEFGRAFLAIGFIWRLAAPSTKHYFSHFVDVANERLAQRGVEGVEGAAVLASIIGHADVPWQAADARIGALLQVGLDEHRGRPCSNRWRAVLDGTANLSAPVAPTERLRQAEAPSPSFYRRLPDGSLKPIGADQTLWG
jgi:hypothetical protein